MKKIIYPICLSVLVVVAGVLCFLLLNTVKPKTFEGRGVEVTLSSDYKVKESQAWDFYVENGDIAFMSNRIGKLSQIGEGDNKISLQTLNLQAYLVLTLAAYKIDEENITIYEVEKYDLKDSFLYCYYTDAEQKYAYLLMVKESENFFYTINVSCDNSKLTDLRDELLAIAVTVRVE